MQQQKVYQIMAKYDDFLFPNDKLSKIQVEEMLLSAPDEFEKTFESLPFRSPKTILILALISPGLGIDRLVLGKYISAFLKSFTLGIFWIIDIITAKKRCRAYNCELIATAFSDPSVISNIKANDEKVAKAVNIAKAAAPQLRELKKSLHDFNNTLDAN